MLHFEISCATCERSDQEYPWYRQDDPTEAYQKTFEHLPRDSSPDDPAAVAGVYDGTVMRSDNERRRFEVLIERPWFVLGYPLTRGGSYCSVGFLGRGVLDWLVTRAYLPRISPMLGGAAISVIVGYLVFRILTDIYQRYRELLDRLQCIAELNHEIRTPYESLLTTTFLVVPWRK